jgi:hypothetical protein
MKHGAGKWNTHNLSIMCPYFALDMGLVVSDPASEVEKNTNPRRALNSGRPALSVIIELNQ